MSLSAAAIAEMLRQNSAEVWLPLLTITHPSLTTVRVVNNTEAIVSRGDAYEAFPFEVALPSDVADRLSAVQLRISNVDRRFVEAVRSLPTMPRVKLEVIAASRPDDVEVGPFEFEMASAQYSVEAIEATLTYEPVMQMAFPAGTFDPQKFPGLFGRTSGA